MLVPWYVSPAVWTYGIAAAAFGLLALLLSLRWRGELRSSFLLGAVLLSTFWAGSTAAFAIAPALPTWKTAAIFDALRVCAFIAFLLLLFRSAEGESRLLKHRGVGYAALAVCLSLAALVTGAHPPGPDAPPDTRTAVAYGLLLTVAIIGLAAAEQLYRRTPAGMRWNVRPLSLGLGGLFLYDLVLYADATLFRALDPALWTARGLAHAFVVPVLGVAAARNREWSFDVALSRGMLVGSAAVLGSAAYLLAIAVLGYYVRFVGGDWGRTLAAALVFGAGLLLALIVFSTTFRSRLRVLIAKNFFAYRYDYREEWLAFTRQLATPNSGGTLAVRCIASLGRLVETANGALWLRRGGAYVQVERSGLPSVLETVAESDDLPAFLRATGWVIDLAEARRQPEKYRGLRLPPWLDRLPDAWLVVPLLLGDDLVGFIVFGRPRVEIALDWEVLDLLKTAGRHAASYLAQAQATEYLVEARKFEAFNRMSAFVVHDLKNLVSQLQLMLRNAERHAANPDFQRDMLKTVEHVVDRMNQLMQQLRAGEQPVERPRAVDLVALARKVAAVRAAGRSGLTVEADAPVMAYAHEDRLERVLGHLVQNAFDAVDGTPAVALRVRGEGEIAVIEVQDNGAGMSAEFIRDRLFKPFHTTKQHGMGIGSYESRQYVESVGGRIAVSSAPGAGTVFRVYLRRAESPARVDHVIA